MGVIDTLGIALTNSIKTNNKNIDSALIVLIPIIISYILTYSSHVYEIIEKIHDFFFFKNYIVWNIDDSKNFSNGWNVGTDFHNNNILREAIILYVGEMSNKSFQNNELKFVLPKGKRSLDKYTNTILPIEGTWVNITPFVQFYYSTRTNVEKDSIVIKRNITLRTHKKNGTQELYKFIQNSIDCYKKINYQDKNLRYMYMLNELKKGTDKEESKITWKKYKLSNKKTFDSLFFPEKNNITKLLDNFTNGKDKYAIHTYPKKLGFLLHGPPGTGKTTLIKAIASYTNRHIINIPMGRIKTNQQLFDILFDLSFDIKNKQINDSLDYKDIIFVMEDIDAATDIVYKRTTGENIPKKTEPSILKKIESDKKQDSILDVLRENEKEFYDDDALNLSGILNALDGIIESEDRMLIITTNHPEKLDDAFIRPGRIDKILNLDYIEEQAAKSILSLYFPQDILTNYDLNNIKTVFVKNNKITPAKLEQKCSEYSNCADIIQFFKSSVV